MLTQNPEPRTQNPPSVQRPASNSRVPYSRMKWHNQTTAVSTFNPTPHPFPTCTCTCTFPILGFLVALPRSEQPGSTRNNPYQIQSTLPSSSAPTPTGPPHSVSPYRQATRDDGFRACPTAITVSLQDRPSREITSITRVPITASRHGHRHCEAQPINVTTHSHCPKASTWCFS